MGTITLHRSGRIVRWLSWVYDEAPTGVGDSNFCLIFWGLVFSPMVALVRLLSGGVVKSRHWAGSMRVAAAGADHVAAFSQRHKTGLKWVLAGASGAYGVAVVGLLVYTLVRVAWWAPLVALAGIGLLVGVGWLLSRTTLGHVLTVAYRAIKARTCPRVVLR